MRCTKAVIFSENLRNNVREIRKNLADGVRLCCAVKANAYGNGAVGCARIFEELGAEYLAIATVSEGIELRENGIRAKLLLLSLADPSEFSEIIQNGITSLVFDKKYIEALDEAAEKSGKKCDVFLAVDTGMGRIGCHIEDAGVAAEKIASSKNLVLAGMITHFAVSDSVTAENIDFTRKQYNKFLRAVEDVKRRGIEPGIRTCCASAGALAFPEMHMDMVRPGIILYGYYADEVSREFLEESGIHASLKPAMQFETKVSAIRTIRKGESVSYGRTWNAGEDTLVAVLPVGYADGLLRRCSPGLEVSINGRAYPVIGRICMDQCMVNLGRNNKDVSVWDRAVIFGPKDGDALFDARDIADFTNTIPYEVLTCISGRVRREFV